MSDDESLTLREGAVSWREVDGETILLDIDNADYLGLNGAGTLLWRLMAAGTTRTRLIGALHAEFGIDTEQATDDVDAFLHQARQRKLLA